MRPAEATAGSAEAMLLSAVVTVASAEVMPGSVVRCLLAMGLARRGWVVRTLHRTLHRTMRVRIMRMDSIRLAAAINFAEAGTATDTETAALGAGAMGILTTATMRELIRTGGGIPTLRITRTMRASALKPPK